MVQELQEGPRFFYDMEEKLALKTDECQILISLSLLLLSLDNAHIRAGSLGTPGSSL